jgi:2-C-methyl-D-erythritol 4-phosphate cytidylyltransferase
MGSREAGRVGAVIVAAGEGRRMEGLDKVLVPLLGQPLIAYSLSAFEACPAVDDVVLVLSPRNLEAGRDLVRKRGWAKVRALCVGGERRQDSVRQGLAHLPACRWVVVHDGARPCLEPQLILDTLEAAQETGAAVAALPVTDTIKSVGPDRVVAQTLDRGQLWAVQTPQAFLRELLERAHREVREEATDDAALVERLGARVKVVAGSPRNLKVTTPQDLLLAQALLAARR